MAKQDEVTKHEQELAEYLQERIKPGLNRGAIPLLARSIAKEIARRERLDGGPDDSEEDDVPRTKRDDEDLEARDADDVDAEAEEDEELEEPEDEAGEEPEDEADEEPEDEADEEPEAESEEEPEDEEEDEPAAEGDESESPIDEFEAEMHELQEELGEDWIVRFSVQGDDAWLTADKKDGSQHVEAPTAEVLAEAVELLNEGGGRSG